MNFPILKKLTILLLITFITCGPSEEEIQSQIDIALEQQSADNQIATEQAVASALEAAKIENEKLTQEAVEEAVFQATSTTTTIKETDPRLALAYTTCSLIGVKGAVFSLESQSLYLDGTGDDDYTSTDVTLTDIICVIGELDVPTPIVSRINNTNSTMGLVEDEFDGINISWTYHPDNGLDIYFKIED